VATGLTPAHVAALRRRGYEVVSVRNNAVLNGQVTLLRAPAMALLRDPVQEVRALGRSVTADRNHYYRSDQAEAGRALLRLAAWPAAPGRCGPAVAIGLIDTGVDTSHPALRGASVQVVRLPDQGAVRPADVAHGTALAALLVGRSPDLPVLAPSGRLIAVDAFQRGLLGDERMEVWDLLAAINAVVANGARVINMSFSGDANELVERALARIHQRGVVAVAAMGNRGPQANPQYPAAYPNVIAVTAVDADQRVYRRASRGAHVDFAAPGVDVPTAEPGGGVGSRSGTSFATPFVSAAAAMVMRQRALAPAGVTRQLAATAKDLGAPGRDDTFGHGLLQLGRLCAAATANLAE
jgi:subtilisin family serine protease